MPHRRPGEPESGAERIAAIVMAAGCSSRMGENKLMLYLDGASLLERAVHNAIAAWLDPVVVVAGFEEERVRREVDLLPVEVVTNPEYEGPSSLSLHTGLRALPADAAAAIVILPDMVHVSADTLRAVRAAAERPAGNAPDGRARTPLVVSRYGDVTAPPILFRRALFDELLAWKGEGCGKPVVQAHAEEAVYLDWPSEALQDVDTPDDLARVAGRPGA